ncbi:hypothetical protein [Granulicella tundricola]|uniref:hypothetical protein n=1 Tax=Granulicella tundricola TaxID=940615 RepID=UPI0005A11161|nr:hypothetical protein [Granulicella tundricola]
MQATRADLQAARPAVAFTGIHQLAAASEATQADPAADGQAVAHRELLIPVEGDPQAPHIQAAEASLAMGAEVGSRMAVAVITNEDQSIAYRFLLSALGGQYLTGKSRGHDVAG